MNFTELISSLGHNEKYFCLTRGAFSNARGERKNIWNAFLHTPVIFSGSGLTPEEAVESLLKEKENHEKTIH